MSRIETVAAPGQAVGTVKTRFTPQPFQRLDPAIEVFGGGAANTPAMLGKSFSALGADLEAMNKADDKLNSLKMEGELLRTKANYNNILDLAQGQDRIDLIKGTSDGDRLPQGTLQERYDNDLAAIRAKYNFITSESTTLADNLVTHNSSVFSTALTAGFVSARTSIAKEITANAIGVAAAGASVAVGSFTQDKRLPKLHRTLNSHMSKAASIIEDKDVGVASRGIRNPDIVKRLKREAESKVLQQAFNELISRGMLVEASDLLDHYTQKGGRLEGAAVAVELRGQLAPFRAEIQGRKEYGNLVSEIKSSTGTIPNLSDVAHKIYTVGDPNKRARLKKVLDENLQLRSLRERQAIRGEMDYVATQITAGQAVDKEQIPTLLKTQPLTAVNLLTGQKGQAFQRAVARSEEQQAWQDGGGGTAENSAVEAFMDGLENRDPARFIKLFDEGTFDGFIDLAQHQSLLKTRNKLAANMVVKEGKISANVKTALQALGFSAKQVKGIMAKRRTHLTEVLLAAHRTNPEPSKAVNATAVIANEFLKVRTEESFLGDTWEFAYLAKGSVAEEVDQGTAVIKNSDKSHRYLAQMFDVDRDDIKKIFENTPQEKHTVQGIAEELNKDPLHTMEETVLAREKSDQIVRDFGVTFPARFVEWYVNHPTYGGGRSYTHPGDVSSALNTLKAASPRDVRGAMEQWLGTLN